MGFLVGLILGVIIGVCIGGAKESYLHKEFLKDNGLGRYSQETGDYEYLNASGNVIEIGGW